jgi:hypothetical protein
MGHDFIDDMLAAVKRVVTPNLPELREILIVCGMPEATQSLQYLSYNRQVIEEQDRTLSYSAVAVINNRNIAKWRLTGYRLKLSRIVFDTRWTRNPLDLFLNNLRCDQEVMDLLSGATADYTLLGILQIEEKIGSGLRGRQVRHLGPVVAVSGLDGAPQQKIADFETRNQIEKMKIRGLPLYRKVRSKPAGA